MRRHDGKFPWTYLGDPIEKVLDAIDMTLDEFVAVCDRFTNKRLFVCDRHGELVKDRDGNLTKINDDNDADAAPTLAARSRTASMRTPPSAAKDLRLGELARSVRSPRGWPGVHVSTGARVCIVDYGMCNLDSVRRAFEEVGARPFVTDEPADLHRADRDRAARVSARSRTRCATCRDRGLDDALTKQVIDEGAPFLGVCLGMQLLGAYR